MKSWYSNSDDIEMKDGSKRKEYRVVFETDSKELKDEIEKFFQSLMDRMEGNGICGTCVWHENFNGTTDWICSNEGSDSYGAVTSYDDYYIDCEQKQ